MKTINWILALLFLTETVTMAQEPERYENKVLLATDDGRELKGTMVKMDGGINWMSYIDDLPYCVLIDKNHNVFILDKTTLELVSKTKVEAKNFIQITHDGYLAYKNNWITTKCKPVFYNFKNEILWTSNQDIVLADRRNNIVVCQEVKVFKDQQNPALTAYDMTTGKALWQQHIPAHYHYPWGEIWHDEHNYDIYYMMADSLVRLNIVTGEMIKLPFVAGVRESIKSKFSFAKSRLLNSSNWLREAYYSYPTSGVLTGTHSNWLSLGDTLLVADANNVYCMDKEFKIFWQTPLPEGLGAKSSLRLDGDRLLMINYGVAFQKGLIGRCGKPFVAVYDLNSGKQLLFSQPKMKKKVTGGCIVPGRAYWQDDKGFSYTDEGDTTVTRIPWKPQTDFKPDETHPDHLICDTVGVVENGVMRLFCTNKEQLVVELYGKDVYVIRTDSSATKIDADKVFFHDDYDLFSTNEEKSRQYVVISDRETWKVAMSFRSALYVHMHKEGNLTVSFPTGFGVVPVNNWRPDCHN